MLAYTPYGAPSDCVFVHGAGGNDLLWRRTLQYLKGPSRAFALNLPGHPQGEITCRSIGEYSEAVHEFIEEARLGRTAVCGHSMGSAIALDLAIRHPDDISALILIGAGAKLGVDPTIVAGLAKQPLKTLEQLITPMSFNEVNIEMGREARVALSFSNLPVFLNDYLACNGFDVRDRLSGIPARTLIICGASDRMTPPKWSEYLQANMPFAQAHFIEGAGHMVPLEKPERTADLIQSFLSEINP